MCYSVTFSYISLKFTVTLLGLHSLLLTLKEHWLKNL